MDDKEIVERLTKVCICKGISKPVIQDAIDDGCHTIEKVWEKTDSGNGACCGHRCAPTIQKMIDAAVDK